MNTWLAVTLFDKTPLKISASTYEDAIQKLTKDAYLGGYQIPKKNIVSVTLVTN